MLAGGIEPVERSFRTFGMTIALEPTRVYESSCVSAVYDRFDNAELLRSSQEQAWKHNTSIPTPSACGAGMH